MSEEVFEEARCHVGTDQDLIVCKKRSSSVDIDSSSTSVPLVDQ